MAKKESKGAITGSDYPVDRLVVPWNASIDSWHGYHKSKTVYSPAKSTWDPDLKIHDGYDSLWKGK